MAHKFNSILFLVFFLFLGLAKIAVAESGYFSGYIVKVHKTAKLAVQAQSLEDLQLYARKTMGFAHDFQQAAQSANDSGFVSQAVDIYTYAQRAAMSTTLPEAREYIATAESFARLAMDQSGITMHDPEFRRNYNDPNDVSYRNYYDANYDPARHDPASYDPASYDPASYDAARYATGEQI